MKLAYRINNSVLQGILFEFKCCNIQFSCFPQISSTGPRPECSNVSFSIRVPWVTVPFDPYHLLHFLIQTGCIFQFLVFFGLHCRSTSLHHFFNNSHYQKTLTLDHEYVRVVSMGLDRLYIFTNTLEVIH